MFGGYLEKSVGGVECSNTRLSMESVESLASGVSLTQSQDDRWDESKRTYRQLETLKGERSREGTSLGAEDDMGDPNKVAVELAISTEDDIGHR